MKKVVRLTESDLIKIVKRVVKEESSPKEKDLYTSLHSLRNSINDIKAPSLLKDKKEALSKLEDILSTVRDMEDKTKSKRERIAQCRKELNQTWTSSRHNEEPVTTDYYTKILKSKYLK